MSEVVTDNSYFRPIFQYWINLSPFLSPLFLNTEQFVETTGNNNILQVADFINYFNTLKQAETSFDILDLLTHLFDKDLQFHCCIGDLCIDRFRG